MCYSADPIEKLCRVGISSAWFEMRGRDECQIADDNKYRKAVTIASTRSEVINKKMVVSRVHFRRD